MCCPKEVLCIFTAHVRAETIVKTAIGTCCYCLTNPRKVLMISTNTHTLSWNADLTFGSTSVYTPIRRMSGMAALMPFFSITLNKTSNYYMNLSDEDRRIVVNFFYSQLQSMRESADYNCSYDVSEDDVVSRIEPARQLVEKIRQYIAMK